MTFDSFHDLYVRRWSNWLAGAGWAGLAGPAGPGSAGLAGPAGPGLVGLAGLAAVASKRTGGGLGPFYYSGTIR